MHFCKNLLTKKDATLKKNVCYKLLNDTCIECSTVMHHMLLVSFKHVHSKLKLFIWCTIDVDFNINEHTLKRLLEKYFKSCHTLHLYDATHHRWKMKTTQLESERIPCCFFDVGITIIITFFFSCIHV